MWTLVLVTITLHTINDRKSGTIICSILSYLILRTILTDSLFNFPAEILSVTVIPSGDCFSCMFTCAMPLTKQWYMPKSRLVFVYTACS